MPALQAVGDVDHISHGGIGAFHPLHAEHLQPLYSASTKVYMICLPFDDRGTCVKNLLSFVTRQRLPH